jgi:hypothetical protein
MTSDTAIGTAPYDEQRLKQGGRRDDHGPTNRRPGDGSLPERPTGISTELLKRSAREEFEAAKSHIAMTKGAGAGIVIVAEMSNPSGEPLEAALRAPAPAQRRLGEV